MKHASSGARIWLVEGGDEPFWLTWSANGKWVYASTGDIIDTSTKQVVASLKDEVGRDVQGEKAVEIIYQDGKLLKAVDQFGIGQVGRSSQP